MAPKTDPQPIALVLTPFNFIHKCYTTEDLQLLISNNIGYTIYWREGVDDDEI
jgi:hypothetical protein